MKSHTIKGKKAPTTVEVNRNIIGLLLSCSLKFEKPINIAKCTMLPTFSDTLKSSYCGWKTSGNCKKQVDVSTHGWKWSTVSPIWRGSQIEQRNHSVYCWCHCSNSYDGEASKNIWGVFFRNWSVLYLKVIKGLIWLQIRTKTFLSREEKEVREEALQKWW